MAPRSLHPATLTFNLVVTDNLGLRSAADEASITVSNQRPLADAGSDQVAGSRALITLDGSDSADPDGDYPLAYGWTQTAGPSVTFTPDLSMTTFMLPADAAVMTFELTVTDSLGMSSPPDEVVVTVQGARVYLPLIIRP